MTGLWELLEQSAAVIRNQLPAGAAPRVGLVLGSGLGHYADGLEGAVAVPFSALPGFPGARVEGHAGRLVYGRAAVQAEGKPSGVPGGVEVLALQGRVHFYEGLDLAQVVLPVRALVAAGCRTLIVTNAAGGIAAELSPGELVLIADHLNLIGGSPLRGANDPRVGLRFPELGEAYDRGLRALATEVGEGLGLALRQGVYAACAGPQYETPAEVRMLRALGADLVGMSTAPEVIAARHMGARVLGISCVTNLAAGLSPTPLSHHEVTDAARRVQPLFAALLDGILARLASAPAAGPR